MKTLRVLGVAGACLALGIGVGCKAPAETAAKAGDVTEARVASESAAETNWLLNGRTFDEAHFSTLQQINDKNVNGLGLAWYMDIDGAMGVVAEPVVVDGVIYLSAPQSRVYAVDAASGKLIWKYDPHVRLNMAINGSYSARTNAGVAVWEGKVYVGTGDCRLIAVDASAGKQLWDATVCDARQTGITGAPHIARGKVLMGYNGSDDGVRGALIAYDAGTGKKGWHFWTVPGDPSKPFETKGLEMAAKTGSGKDSGKIGGGEARDRINQERGKGVGGCWEAGGGGDSKVSRRRQTVDGAQLVADELQRADRAGVHSHDRPPGGCQSRGGIRRKRRGVGRATDRVGSAEPVGALVGGRADCDEWGSALHGGQSGFSGARHGRVCRVCRGQRKAIVVDQDRLGDRVHSRDVFGEGRAVRDNGGRLGIGIA